MADPRKTTRGLELLANWISRQGDPKIAVMIYRALLQHERGQSPGSALSAAARSAETAGYHRDVVAEIDDARAALARYHRV